MCGRRLDGRCERIPRRPRADRCAAEDPLGRERLEEQRREVIVLDQDRPTTVDRPLPDLVQVGRAIRNEHDLVEHGLLAREHLAADAEA